MSILFLLVTVLPVTLTVFIIISFFCFCINCSPEPHADSVNIQQYKYSWFYYINVTTFHLAVIMMILFWQDRLPLYAHLCVYIFILMKGYPLMTLITFDPQTPLKNRRQKKPSPKFMFFYSWIYYSSVSMFALIFFHMSLNP